MTVLVRQRLSRQVRRLWRLALLRVPLPVLRVLPLAIRRRIFGKTHVEAILDAGITRQRELQQLQDEAERALHKLSATVLEGLRPPAGPYAFFHHSSHALERLQDCGRVVERLWRNRTRVTILATKLARTRDADWPAGTPYPPRIQELMREESKLTSYMKQDLESLYMFGGILLDQWALQGFRVAGKDPNKPQQHPFRELVEELERSAIPLLVPMWKTLSPDMLWLYYQIRFYRNKFVVHGNRPWQRGTTMSVYGNDFNLFTPTPPGWLDDDALDRDIQALIHLAPQHLQQARADYWERARSGALIERLFDNIGNIATRVDRERVASLLGKKGGSTPSFDSIASRLFAFIAQGTAALDEVASANLQTVKLGAPHRMAGALVDEDEMDGNDAPA